MNPEPLSGKINHNVDSMMFDHVNFSYMDVVAAVEWLKQREWILGHGKCSRCGNYHTYREHRGDEFICFRCCVDEAFADVVEKGEEK